MFRVLRMVHSFLSCPVMCLFLCVCRGEGLCPHSWLLGWHRSLGLDLSLQLHFVLPWTFSPSSEEGQTPLVFSPTLWRVFSTGILRSSHDCVYPLSLQVKPLFEESKDFAVQLQILYFLVLLEVAFQHFVTYLYASFPCPATAGIAYLFQGTKCSGLSMDPRFLNSTWLICNFSKTKMASGHCWTNSECLFFCFV